MGKFWMADTVVGAELFTADQLAKSVLNRRGRGKWGGGVWERLCIIPLTSRLKRLDEELFKVRAKRMDEESS
jgi:hypothetical protein